MQRNTSWSSRIDWGHVLVVLGIAVGICIYLADTIRASSKVGNLVLILPASTLGLALCALTFVTIIRDARHTPEQADAAQPSEPFYERVRPLLLLGLFTLYIVLLPVLGMDLGAIIFLMLALVANGERRPVFILLYSVIFALLVTLLFKSILPYPMPTRIL